MKKKKIGVLISGGGSNLQALIEACAAADYPAEISVVISNKESAYGLNRAREHHIPAHIINHKDYETREAFDDAMHTLLMHHQVDIVCLAGFMRLLSPAFVKRWQDRMLNIHPSLLPAFKGAHAHEDVLASGVRFSGCTVHFVRPEMDSGPVIVQAVVPVLPQDTLETLAARVLEQEHRIYPLALRWLAEGRLSVSGNKVMVKSAKAADGALINPL
ncbi:MAG: phosphoribosylglycinamide formyltransferase [Pseudomonadota bacterium]|nr:phosphoribosylglycinamide formyltransferase [Pseudomonadota bacterium]